MRILHLDGGHGWAGGQNQLRLLMRELAGKDIVQSCFCPRDSNLAQRLAAEGLPVITGPWRGGADARAVLRVARLARHFDILHCHDAHALQIAWLPARLFRRRLVAARRVHFKTSSLKWNRPDAVIAISETVAASLIAAGVNAARIQRIPSGIDVREVKDLPLLRPHVRVRAGVSTDAFVAGCIGQLAAYKGQTIIPAAARGTPDTHWLIIGDGPLRAEIASAIAELGVAARVHLLGYIDDARRALREFDVFVFPSPAEPLGTSVLDAMACGIPVVAARAAGAAEILAPVDAQTGSSLFTPGDAAGLAALLTRLRTDEGQRQRMRELQYQRLQDFTSARTAHKTLELYRSLLRA